MVKQEHVCLKKITKKKETGALLWDTSTCIILGKLIDSRIGLSDKFTYVSFFFIGGYDIPKGTVVLSNFYAIHRDPHHWKNPESFDPSRFLKKDGTLNAKPDSYLPFSAGRRVCLGEPVAKPELLLMCATLLQRLELCLPEGVRPCYEGIPLSFGLEAPKSYKIVVKDRQNANCWIFIIYNIII